MIRNWKRWMILRAFHPGAEYEKEVEQSASFKEDIPLSACCLTVLSLYGVNRNDPLPISKKKEEVPVMRAAKMKERPTFQLMCQTDVQSIYHMQMPRWLFSDPRYCEMSLDAKVTYTFLLNRFQLSRKNGWVNDRGEVFVIFPRKALAKSCASVSSGSRQLLRSWWSSSWYGKNAAGEVMPIRSILPVSHRSKIRTIPVRRLSRRMNRKYAVQEPRIWRVLLTGNPQQHAKNRRICCPRIVKIALQELQNPRSQNRRN